MKHIFRYFIFLILFSLHANSQDTIANASTKELRYDISDKRQSNPFDENTIKEFRSQKDFDYREQQEPDNIWTRFKFWLSQIWKKFISWVFGIKKVSGFWEVVFTILPYVLIVAVLFLLGWLFMKVNPKDMLFEKQDPPQIQLTEDEDIIKNQDIQQLIDKALKENNYRLAIRYYYLFILKKLSDHKMIEWEAQKTNTDYIKELKDNSLQHQFKNITRVYDFIWYGSFELDKESYLFAEKQFQSINQTIQN
ncbi:DUF4129 domain-containing protein [Aquimarina algicola]|uniref:DUF4129 domain-containing protein n=1 Tax=Aquimarina algicola TaxID=2589995 RepID=A0A504JC74_9FLAO|nr:DUF4129 domain-containing protein [Aquimarina algicola]TPN85173.1 DUF4129 domain-containing protein [Aquimarina algicola]